MDTIEFLGSAGFEVTVLKVDGSGLIDPDDLRRAIRPSTGLISLMHVNNETGTIHPIAEIARIAAETGVTLHTDAVQSFCKIPSGSADALRLDEAPAGPRLVSISAHKVYGPKGIGALIRRGVSLDKTMHGGGQERGLRGGTENVAFAAAFAAAAAASAARAEAEFVRLGSLKKAFQQMLKERVPGVRFNGHPEKSIPHIVSISIEEGGLSGGSDRGKGGGEGVIDGETLLFGLDLEGICASGGSACTSGSVEPSHVLSAMGIPAATARATVRFSMGLSTTLEELERTATCLGDIVSQTLGLPAGRR
jgi:cysteine desulfurase